MRVRILCRIVVIVSVCLSPFPGKAHESTSDEREQREFNSGLDPTNFPPTYGIILSQAKFTTGDRLRSASLRGVYKFDRDYVAATLPILDFVPGTPSGSYATGTGDFLVEYLHVFPNLSDRAVHGLGVTLQFDTASKPQLGSSTTVLQPLYALSYYKKEAFQLVLVVRYLRDIGARFAKPLTDTLLLSPFVVSEWPGNWYGQVRFNNFIDATSSPNTFTSEVGIGNVIAGHYNVGFFYEFPLNRESRVFNVEARFSLNLFYQF